MKVTRKINLNVSKTVENAVCGRDDFHFYVDELTSDNMMPTYSGNADEKYSFDEMDDSFFEFLKRKSKENGIYIRLIHASGRKTDIGAVFKLECGKKERTFVIHESVGVCVFEFADFGIRVLDDEITFGATVEDGDSMYFAPFKSGTDDMFLSAENPLNQLIAASMCELIELDE